LPPEGDLRVRQTALLAILIALFQPDMGKIRSAAAALDRRA
jgi:hypothetical protein